MNMINLSKLPSPPNIVVQSIRRSRWHRARPGCLFDQPRVEAREPEGETTSHHYSAMDSLCSSTVEQQNIQANDRASTARATPHSRSPPIASPSAVSTTPRSSGTRCGRAPGRGPGRPAGLVRQHQSACALKTTGRRRTRRGRGFPRADVGLLADGRITCQVVGEALAIQACASRPRHGLHGKTVIRWSSHGNRRGAGRADDVATAHYGCPRPRHGRLTTSPAVSLRLPIKRGKENP